MDRAGLGKLHDTIPLVAGTAERAVLFPSPDLHQRVQRLDTGCIEQWNGTEWVELLCAGEGGGGSFIQADYVVVNLSDDLTSERRLQVGAGLTMVDGGANGDITLSVSCPNYCGNGSPEGVVAAPVGSWYLQRDAASTTHPLWAKRTGSSNTGWVAYAGHRGTGTQSLRLGDSSVASATDALAIGQSATASGVSAIAIGKSTTASGQRSEAIGEGSSATATDAKAFGVGATASGATSLAVGAGASASGARAVAIGGASSAADDDSLAMLGGVIVDGSGPAIAIGPGTKANSYAPHSVVVGGITAPPDMEAVQEGDVILGFDHQTGRGDLGTTYGNVVIGLESWIKSVSDAESLSNAAGGHVLIGYRTITAYDQTDWPNIVIGKEAWALGRADVVIGADAAAAAASGSASEGNFAVVIGYGSIGRGGCICAVGDQAVVHGDRAAALGTHAQANDDSTAALGPDTFAGSVASDGSGLYAAAVGVDNDVTGTRSTAVGNLHSVSGTEATTLGSGNSVTHNNAHAFGRGVSSAANNSVSFGSASYPVTAIYFNGAASPGLTVDAVTGKVTVVP